VSATSSETAPLGHNNPPAPTLAERIEADYAEKFAEIVALAEAANAAPLLVLTDEDVGTVSDVVVKARALGKALEAARKREKQPFIDDGKLVDTLFTKARLERLETISTKLTERVTTYNRVKADEARKAQREAERVARDLAEQARLDAEMEAQGGNTAAVTEHVETALQAEQQARQAAAPVSAADATRVRSGSGAVATTRTVVKARVIDPEKLDLNKLRGFIKPEHIDEALRRFVATNKKTIPIPGVEFYDDETAVIRS
jgi:hypothetical protein